MSGPVFLDTDGLVYAVLRPDKAVPKLNHEGLKSQESDESGVPLLLLGAVHVDPLASGSARRR